MKILDARDGVIKYETFEKVILSSFLEIDDSDRKYIAQVIRENYNGAGYTVYARILFNYDGSLKSYDGSLPDLEAEITTFDFDIISKTFESIDSVIVNKFFQNNNFIKINSNSLDKNILISIDNSETLNTVISNLTLKNKNNILLDLDGSLKGNRYYAGKDFKLPFDVSALDFIYNDCLTEATSESKSLIKDIFRDLTEYLKTVPYLPFTTFKSIIDDMVKNAHEFRLIVLKNILERLEKLEYFATKNEEISNLENILKSNAIIDFSRLDNKFVNKYVQYIYDTMRNLEEKPQVFIKLSDAVNKRTINKIYTSDIKSVFAIHSKLRYLAGMKSLFNNFMIESTTSNKEVFNIYRPFLDSMQIGNCLLVGRDTNNIPIVFKAEKLDISDIQPEQKQVENTKSETTNEENLIEKLNEELPTEDDSEEASNFESEDSLFNDDEDDSNIEEVKEDDSNLTTENTEESLFNDDFHTQIDSTKYEDITEIEEIPEGKEEINNINESADEKETISDSDIISENNELVYEDSAQEEVLPEEESTVVELDSKEIDSDIIEDIEDIEESGYQNQEEEITEDNKEYEEPDEGTKLAFEESRAIDVDALKVMPLNGQEDELQEDEIIELDSDDANSEDIMVELDDEPDFIESDSEALNKEITEDVDKVFTTVKDDSISDTDLDLIDELNELDSENSIDDDTLVQEDSMDGLEELAIPQEEDDDSFLEPLAEISDSGLSEENSSEILETKQSNTPIVPVYDAEIPPEDMVSSDPIEQGDTVVHAKYGTGIVEKMIKYGNKNLYSINFDNVGRRLLDPALTEIKKSVN